MFDTISSEYDKLNRMITFGVDLSWRKKLVHHIVSLGPETVLDVATGTGDLAIAIASTSQAKVTGLDISAGMLEVGKQIAMHIAATSPLGIDKKDLKKEIIDKELEIIKAELANSGKKGDIAEKISTGKINKFISDNTLLNQIWIMDPKKKVSDILKENKIKEDIKIIDFIRFKVGEGI